jgi:hypothetical protein
VTDTLTYAFLGPTVAAPITAGQVIIVHAQAGLGSVAAGGATLFKLSICQRVNGTTVTPADHGGDYMESLRVPQNTRLSFALSTRFAGLTAGTYQVGLCYLTVAGQAATWNSNDWGRITAIVAKQ